MKYAAFMYNDLDVKEKERVQKIFESVVPSIMKKIKKNQNLGHENYL